MYCTHQSIRSLGITCPDSYKKLETRPDPSAHRLMNAYTSYESAPSAEHPSARGDEVRLRRREGVREEGLGGVRRGQEHHAPRRGELLPQRVPHPARGGAQEARDAVTRGRPAGAGELGGEEEEDGGSGARAEQRRERARTLESRSRARAPGRRKRCGLAPPRWRSSARGAGGRRAGERRRRSMGGGE